MAGKKSLLAMSVAGLVAGAGGGAAATLLLPAGDKPRPPVESGEGQFVTLGELLIPLSLANGRFTGYCRVEAQLEVAAADAEGVTARLPLIIHAVNIRAYQEPLAAGPDGRLPDAAAIRSIVSQEAGKLLGKGVVRSVALTSLAPA
jgi:hypothetical protein